MQSEHKNFTINLSDTICNPCIHWKKKRRGKGPCSVSTQELPKLKDGTFAKQKLLAISETFLKKLYKVTVKMSLSHTAHSSNSNKQYKFLHRTGKKVLLQEASILNKTKFR